MLLTWCADALVQGLTRARLSASLFGPHSREAERMVARSHARLSAFARGVVWGLHVAGWKQSAITKAVRKTDGLVPSDRSVSDAISRGAKKDAP